jgi:Beta-L-arabinofuranosidase, GH127 middle domain/Beta-L-arabinofuranosidase, GH127 catalytic domain
MGLDRRKFIQQAGVASLATVAMPRLLANSHSPTYFSKLIASSRPPLAQRAFNPLPLTSIEPLGWLRDQLEIQANGLSGHLDEVWPDVGPNSGWLGGSGESWERGPYYLDGLIPLAWQLNHRELMHKAYRFLDWTLDNAQPSGFFGPRSNNDWWPRIVMLKAMTQYYEVTADPRVIPVMERYFAYSLYELPHRPLRDWARYRWQDEVLSVLWLYNRYGNPSHLRLAHLLRQQGYDWQAQFEHFTYTQRCTPQFLGLTATSGLTDRAMQTHGVNNAMAIKASPLTYLLTSDPEDQQAVFQQLDELYRYHGIPNGMFSADEHFAGRNPSQGIELCAVVETMFSLEQSIAILGSAPLGDRLEKIAFNALPGAFTDDMWAHQYNQEPNQIEVSLHREPWTTDGPESNIYGLAPNFGCCTANYHQGWPKFTASLWMESSDHGLAAIAYAPCRIRTTVGSTHVSVTEETSYPFRGEITLRIEPASPIAFPLHLRIPTWTQGAQIRINGELQPAPTPGTFARIQRTWKPGDDVAIVFPMQPRVSRGFHRSITLERGPLVFSHAIGQAWLKLRDRGKASDWQVYPTSAWNYALAVDEANVASAVRVEETPVTTGVFTAAKAPLRLHIPTAQDQAWFAQDGVAQPLPQSPVKTQTSLQEIALIPYAAAKLRITAFPERNSEA